MSSDSTAHVDVDLSALITNFERLAAASVGATPAAVMKCDGYGLGAIAAARVLAKRKNCQVFFVAHAIEGVQLRAGLADLAPGAEIFVLNGPIGDLQIYHDARLTPVLNSLDQAKQWVEAHPDMPAAVHFDTGFNRLGAPEREIDAILSLKRLRINMVMSHLAHAGTRAHPATGQQKRRFDALQAKCPDARRSLVSTGGALIGPDYGADLLRLGIGLYGVSPFGCPVDEIDPVATLSAPVIQIFDIAPGDAVGYDGLFVADRPTRIATLSIGYGDGFPRAAGDGANVSIGGFTCPVVGRVSMDLTTIDITHAPGAISIGDRAEIFGRTAPIEHVAKACNTIGYELLTRLGRRVERRYWLDGTRAPAWVIDK